MGILRENEKTSLTLHTDKITLADEDTYIVSSGMRDFPLCTIGGINFRPAEGERMLMLSGEEGKFAIGSLCYGGELEPGEITLSCGGGQIKLCADGSVNINGLTITTEGEIITPTT